MASQECNLQPAARKIGKVEWSIILRAAEDTIRGASLRHDDEKATPSAASGLNETSKPVAKSDEKRTYRALETWMRVELAKRQPEYDEFKHHATCVMGLKGDSDLKKLYDGFVDPDTGIRPKYRFSDAFDPRGNRFGTYYLIEEDPECVVAEYRFVPSGTTIHVEFDGGSTFLRVSASKCPTRDEGGSYYATVDDRWTGVFATEQEAMDWIVTMVRLYGSELRAEAASRSCMDEVD